MENLIGLFPHLHVFFIVAFIMFRMTRQASVGLGSKSGFEARAG